MRDAMRPSRFLSVLLLSLPFVVPLAGVAVPVPGMLGSASVVRLLAAAALPCAVVLGWGTWRRTFRDPVVVALALFLAAAGVSSVTGIDPYRSLWGEPLRAEGLLQMLSWAGVFLAAAIAFRDATVRRGFLTAVVLAALAFGAAAVFGETLRWLISEEEFNYRLLGVYLNPLYFGNVMALSAGCALLLARTADERMRRLAYVAAAALGFIALASGARSVVFGAAGGVLVAGTLAATAGGIRVPSRHTARIIIALIAVCAVLLLLSPRFFGRLEDWNPGESSVASRVDVWRSDLPAIRARPLLGWGPESHLIIFHSWFTADFYRWTTEVYDRAHNSVVETLITTGAIGFAAAAVLLAALAATLLRLARRDPHSRTEAVLLAGVFGYALASDVFGFQTPYSMALLVPLVGMAVGAAAGHALSSAAGRGRTVAVVLATAIAITYAAVTVFLPLRSGLLAVQAVDRYPEDLTGATRTFVRATAIPTFVDDISAKRFSYLVAQEILTRQVRDREGVLSAGRAVEAVFLREEAKHPWDPTLLMLHGSLLEQLGKLDPSFWERSGPLLESLVARYPERFESRQLLALVYLRQGRMDQALDQYVFMLSRNPKLATLHELYAITLYRAGRTDDALAALDEALRLSPSSVDRIARIRERILAGESVDSALDAVLPVATDVDG